MNRTTLHKIVASTIFASTAALAATTAQAVPVNGQYLDDPRCDMLPNISLTHELGQQTFFPLNEAFTVQVQPSPFTVCVPDDGLANDWIVVIRNVSGIAWTDLHFVVDQDANFGNADGVIADLAGPAGLFTDAMRIDGTVTPGINNNLLNESMTVDEIFEPGEIWRFNVSNFNNIAAFNQPPIFRTPGVFAGSSPLGGGNPGNASILANPVPEPSAIIAIGALAGAMLLRRPRR